MKKILFVLLMLLTWYLAAMYHLISLMTLALAEILFFLGMFLASRYLRRHTKVRFSGPTMVITKNQKTPCRIVMEHTGILPPGRLRLRFRLAYWDQKGETTGFFYHHGLGGEQEEAGFYLDAPWCGQLIISMERVQIFDYVSLFQAGLLAGEELEAAVLPGGAAMTIRISEEFGNQQGWEAEIQPFVGMGDGEIRQLRDYFPGDPHRLIHWKQSARMDTLLVKEQGPRQEQSAWLYLDLHSDQPKSARELDAFFEILHSLILGLMEEAFTLLVRWKEPDGSWAGMEAADREDGSALLLRLYQSESMPGGAPTLIPPKHGLCLNVDRKLVSGGRQEMRDGSVLDLLCCLAAVYGLLFLLHSVEGMAFRLGASLLIASIPGIVLWYFRRRKNAGLFWGCFCHDRSPGTGFSHPLAAVWPDYFGFASSSVFGDGSRFAAGVSAFGLSNRFLGDQWMAEWNAERLFQLVYQGEGLVQRTVKQISGSAAHPNGGTVNRGNLYPAGTRQLEVRTSQKPTETIYLKGFTGGSYHEGEWEAADDETLFSQMEEHSLHWGQWSNWIPGMYRSMYFVMNANTMREEPLEARQMWIQQREDAGLQSYTPYFSMENRRRWEEETWEDRERYLYYEMGEMNIAWDNIPASFAAGYAVSPSAFALQEDGTYLAEVTDASAHAWAEISVEDYGWIPIEVTPSGDSQVPVYPGMDSAQLEEWLGAANWNWDILNPVQEESSERAEEPESAGNPGLEWVFPDVGHLALGLPLCLGIAADLFFIYRIRKRLDMEEMTVGETYARLVKAVRLAGFHYDYDDSEETFLLHLPKVVPGFTDEQAKRLLKLVLEASFGNVPVEPVSVSEETAQIVRFALQMAEKTKGALDPTIYPVLTAWGFTTDQKQVPSDETIASLLSRVGYNRIRLEGTELTVPDGMQLDLGAVGKGYAGDLVTQTLQEYGISHALINLGGNVQAVGSRPDGSDWRIGIRAPWEEGNLGVLEISDAAVVTSGGYENYFEEEDGRIYWHILDPSTGYPADGGLRAVTIIGKEGKLCDALSTALFVMGAEKAEQYWRENGGFDMMLITENNEIILTEGIAGQFTLGDGRTETIRVLQS